MKKIQSVRGTHDLLPNILRKHKFIENTGANIAALYGFAEIETPVFEFTDVFARSLGVSSDVVSKEMYSFNTKGGENITLRPEGTAGIARAFISNGLAQHVPLKLFYRGPMFRHERPQKGRQRQFHQMGVELLGAESPQADVEVVSIAHRIIRDLGLSGGVRLETNSLGDVESRALYKDALIDFFSNYKSDLSPDSLHRLNTNPLRILDSKDEGDKKLVQTAPRLVEFLNYASEAFINEVYDGLAALGIPFKENPNLVRGLDYYCHTAFEFVTDDLGAQGTVLGGGRYNGLIEQLGGTKTAGVGWAAGLERLAMMVEMDDPLSRPVAVVPLLDELASQGRQITHSLREAGIVADIAFAGNVKRRLRRADKINALCVVILGPDELEKGSVVLKDYATGKQTTVSIKGLDKTIKSRYR